MTQRGRDEMSELRFCHVIGGHWRVPLPEGPPADLARALALARPAPGLPLPPPVAEAVAGLPAVIRAGAAILLAPPARAEPALLALAAWLHHARHAGGEAAALSLIQPLAADRLDPLAATLPADGGWRFIPLFSARVL